MPTIEELIKQTTGKSFEEMDDAELIDLVNSTRNCYQVLSGAAKARKAKREGKTVTAAVDWSDIDLDMDDDEEEEAIDFGNIDLELGD